MIKYTPAARPEILAEYADQPVLGLQSEPILPMFQNLAPSAAGEDTTIWPHYYAVTSYPVAPRGREEAPTPRENHVGVWLNEDDYDPHFPPGMYKNGIDVPSLSPLNEGDAVRYQRAAVITSREQAYEVGLDLPGSFLERTTAGTQLFVGSSAISGLLEGFADIVELDAAKYFPWYQRDYLLPRVENDFMHLAVTSFAAGVPASELPIPEEHRFRVLVSIAEKVAHYQTKSQAAFDKILDKRLKGESLECFTDHELDLVHRIYHGSSFQMYGETNPSMALLAQAYRLHPSELTETTQLLWGGQQEQSTESDKLSLSELYEYWHRPRDPEANARFIERTPPDRLAYYYEMIRQTVYALLDSHDTVKDHATVNAQPRS